MTEQFEDDEFDQAAIMRQWEQEANNADADDFETIIDTSNG